MIYDRIFLASLIAGNWALIRIIEELLPEKALNYLPKPFAIYAVLVFALCMAIHSIWFGIKQKRKGYFKTSFETSNDELPNIKRFPNIDIFIAMHNEEKVIAQTIENLLQVNYPNYFIYLINDRSDDDTKNILNEYQNRFPNKIKAFHIQDSNKGGKSAALNYAFHKSNGELIAVFDADAKIEEDFFYKMLPYLDDENIAAVQCKKSISNYSFNNLTKLQENEFCLDAYFQCGRDVIDGNVELRGNGQIIKRKPLKEVGLWDEDTLTDDLELSTRFAVNDYKIRFCKEAQVFEQAPIDFSSLLKQRLRWCEGSLRRYLYYIPKIFAPGKISHLPQQFDTFVFLAQFAVPMWIFFDVIAEAFRFLTDRETHLTFLMLATFTIWCITWINALLGIKIYRKLSWRTSALRAFETNMYFLTLWPTVVLLTVRKILFSRTTGKWHRTEHYSDIELEKV